MRIRETTNNDNFVPVIQNEDLIKKTNESKPTYNDHHENCQCEECQEWLEEYNIRNNTTYSSGNVL